ncbi:CocE/NonD family hydrolase [Biostraticola tofi]|nr:CocE/NonD family hydrolase [Biostraticola tofi]
MKRIVSDFPFAFHITEHLWIPLSDGMRLAARMWLPDTAFTAAVPAILEYLPYRKRDGTRSRDQPMHGYFAGHGFAVLRVDMRGCGESDGLLADEYLLQEQQDALEVIDWISHQRWCSGQVGMMGKSWGGFNSLQLAARRPPALKAIIAVCSSDDRYSDDIHYKGGCLLNDNLWWGGIMLAYQSRPPDPALLGPSAHRQWLARLERMPFFPAIWLAHPLRDDYWRQGSIAEDWAAIQCPVLAVGGWADAYSNAVFRLMDNLQAPARAIIGPWAHVYPHDGTPEPAIGFLQQAVAWWDRWLKGKDNDAMNGSKIQAWINDSQPPSALRPSARGEWVGFDSGSASNIRSLSLYLDRGRLDIQPTAAASWLPVCSPQSHGLMGGEWMGTGILGESPPDQRIDDGQAVIFDGAPLAEPLSIFGRPLFHVRLKSDKPAAMLYVRLSDVSTDGAVNRVTHGWKNLAHLQGPDEKVPLIPGETVYVSLLLDGIGWRFAAGHRLRLSVATTFWPLVWPMPEEATLTLDLSSARLSMPVCDAPLSITGPAESAETAADTPLTVLSPGRVDRHLTYDVLADCWTAVTHAVGGVFGEGVYRLDEINTQVDHRVKRQLSIKNHDPLSARYRLTQSLKMGRKDWWTEADISLEMTSTLTHFIVQGRMKVSLNGKRVADKQWHQSVER